METFNIRILRQVQVRVMEAQAPVESVFQARQKVYFGARNVIIY